MSLAISSTSFRDPAATSLFQGYQPPPGKFDEMFSAPGVLRPHWKQFVEEALDAMGAASSLAGVGKSWQLG